MSVPVVAIDGPSASGKGTIAERVAEKLGFHVLDSGALYRLTALYALQNQVDLADEAAVATLAARLPASFSGGEIWLDGENATEAIRLETIGEGASKVAALPAVREALLARQRDYAQAPGLVADGRDMGSVVFPQARVKVFLTASPEARAERRYKQLIEKGNAVILSDLVQDMRARDARDSQRAVAPLKPAPGASLLDSTHMGIEEVVNTILQYCKTAGI